MFITTWEQYQNIIVTWEQNMGTSIVRGNSMVTTWEHHYHTLTIWQQRKYIGVSLVYLSLRGNNMGASLLRGNSMETTILRGNSMQTLLSIGNSIWGHHKSWGTAWEDQHK